MSTCGTGCVCTSGLCLCVKFVCTVNALCGWHPRDRLYFSSFNSLLVHSTKKHKGELKYSLFRQAPCLESWRNPTTEIPDVRTGIRSFPNSFPESSLLLNSFKIKQVEFKLLRASNLAKIFSWNGTIMNKPRSGLLTNLTPFTFPKLSSWSFQCSVISPFWSWFWFVDGTL